MSLKFILSVCLLSFSMTVLANPKIESWVTAKGAKVLFVKAETLPMLDVRVVFDAGSARDEDAHGLAAFTNKSMNEGAGEWDADVLSQRLDDRGIQLGSGALRDMAWLSVRTLSETETRDVAIESLAQVLAKPRFDSDAVERVRQKMKVAVRRTQQSPSKIASQRFYNTLYAGHPYAHSSGGSEESLKNITAANLRTFHQRYYVAANAVIAIVGDLTLQQAKDIADKLTANLASGQHASLIAKVPETKGGELRQSFPSSQTHIYVGQRGVTRADPDYFSLYVGNHVLGGGALTSILGEEVRNKRGLSYSVYSYFAPMRAQGPFLMVAQTKNKKADEALSVMNETLRKFIKEGPTAELLKASKQNIMGGFPLKVASNRKTVEYISMMGFYNLPLNWLETLVSKVDAITVKNVKDAFKRRVNPDKSIAIVVGGK